MHNPIFRLAVVLLATAFVVAPFCQAQSEEPKAQGYLFMAPGATKFAGDSQGNFHFGGGGEYFVHRGLAVGGELGYLTPWSDFGSGLGVLSLNGAYNFGTRSRHRVSPYLTGGYSLGFRNGHINMVNFGAGMDYWYKNNQAVRFEFRDHVYPNDFSNVHYFGFRFGWMFR